VVLTYVLLAEVAGVYPDRGLVAKLNRIGKWAMNSPQRALAQRLYVAPLFNRLGGTAPGGIALEVGCGRGVGTEIILQEFGFAEVMALDFDSEMVVRARRRLARFDSLRAHVGQGDAARMSFADGRFDAVFDFGAIHQIGNWQSAVSEVRRVLKPGGRFFFEEIAWRPLRWLMRFTVEEYDSLMANPFSPETFLAELERQGFEVRHVTRRFLSLTGVIGDLIGVAKLTKISLHID
jgi:ubiquinone/menaquinone biosynthesis C-methylase UbiE